MITIATLFLPLLSSIFCGLFSTKLSQRQAGLISTIMVTISAIFAIVIFSELSISNEIKHIVPANWLSSDLLEANWSIYVDQLTSLMLIVVTIISALVHIYSIGYMATDQNLPRFMAYLSLFTFFMLLLVTADNFMQLFCGWEGVGFCSYLLIGFWYKKRSACAAAMKAFIVNRVADFAFIIAICLVFFSTGSIEFIKVFNLTPKIQQMSLHIWGYQVPFIEVVCFLIFVGCMGKSAQIGLHIWLPDAMEGPTPVSALIHAATMVTAGVFMVAKCSHLFEYAPLTLQFITVTGSVTCLFAATIAVTQTDIKKIIAYSTCSQLGYMFFARGLSSYNVGIFHLFTHAFFKALLFLGAGSVIHAVSGEQDITKMGGLWKKTPVTYALFWIGSLAIAGVFPFAGYFSKDLILEVAYASGTQTGYFAFWLGTCAAFLTALYSWRLIILVFHGTTKLDKNTALHVHESPNTMLGPMVVLSLGAIFAGIYGIYILQIDKVPGCFAEAIFVREANRHIEHIHHLEWYIKLLPTIAGIAGIVTAYALYFKLDIIRKNIIWFRPAYLISYNKYYIDELYNKTLVILYKLSTIIAKIFDIKIIDRFGPDGAAFLFARAANALGTLQTGYIFSYAFFILLGMVIPISWFVYNTIY